MITIRPARPPDRRFVLALADRLADFDPPVWRTSQEIAEGDRRALADEFNDPPGDHGLFVAELDARPAGCLLMWTLQDYFSGERHAHISVIAVTREAEGRGVGAALMAHAESWARARGSRRLTLSVFASNHRAQRLYERSGYEVEMLRYVKVLD